MTAFASLAIRRPALVVLARASNAAIALGTSMYCLLIYSPFTFQQFIKPQVSAPLAALAVWHSALYWLVLAVTALTLAPELERGRARHVGWSYLAASAAFGLWLSTHPVLAQPDPGRANLAYALLVLLFPIWLSVFDHLAVAPPWRLVPSNDRRGAAACWLTAVFVWAVFLVAVPIRLRLSGGIDLSAGRLLIGLVVSAISHLTAFAFVGIGLMVASGIAALTRSPGRLEYWLLATLSALATAVVMQSVVLAPIAVTGAAGWLVSAAIGITSAAVWSAIGRIRAAAFNVSEAEWTSIDAWLAPIALKPSTTGAISGLLLVSLLAQMLIARVATFDWDFTVQKIVALATWVVAFGLVQAIVRVRTGSHRLLGVPAAVLLLLVAEILLVPRIPAWTRNGRLNPEFALDAYAAVDPSYRVIRDAMRPGKPVDVVAFYAYLRANTGIRQRIEPAPIDFVRNLTTADGPRPHIFLLLVDSLRRDYLSVHNPAVTFTPEIAAFAADSYVFERAYTRYGGTGLAVPSIWAGGLLPHKEYVTPFAPMNTLKKLVDAKGYRQFVTADHITDQLFVPASQDTVLLQRNVSEMAHSFCPTIDELTAAVRGTSASPIFGHTRTLDLHIGNIWNAKVPPGESYPGFFGPYAARVHAIDSCFARFVAFLKETNLYDQSVIVLTSDHGDSLGEEARWGHGFTVFPEVMRIPLIIHLPKAMSERVETDLSRVSFATDITPTLYALLGEQPDALGAQFGSPLFARRGADRTARTRESYLVASSYGPSYGLIRHNGRSLYIADATYGRDYVFDLRQGAGGRRIEITDAERAANRQRIRDEVAAIAARYHFTPP